MINVEFLLIVFILMWGRNESIMPYYLYPEPETVISQTKNPRQDHALLIANEAYEHLDNLVHPARDILTLDSILRHQFGFHTRVLLNYGINEIKAALDSVQKADYGERDQLLVYYAGHGYYDARANKGYLTGIDADRVDNSEYLITSRDICELLEKVDANHVLYVADACLGGKINYRPESVQGRNMYQDINKYEFIDMKLNQVTRKYFFSGGDRYDDGIASAEHAPFSGAFITSLTARDYDGIITLNDLLRTFDVDPYPIIGSFGKCDPGGDFLFISQPE